MLFKNILIVAVTFGTVFAQEPSTEQPVAPGTDGTGVPPTENSTAVPDEPVAPGTDGAGVPPTENSTAVPDDPVAPGTNGTGVPTESTEAGIPGGFVDIATSSGLTALVDAAGASGANEEINALSNVTLFAPNNEAFGALMKSMPDLDDATIQTVLKLHIISGAVLSTALPEGETEVESMVPGEKLKITKTGTEVTVAGAGNEEPIAVVTADVQTSQGIVHVIDGVLMPSAAGLEEGAGSANGTSKGNDTATENESSSATAGAPGFGFLTYIVAVAGAFALM